MKSFFLLPALLLGLAPISQAAVILPNLYASEYCSLRSMGVDDDGASRAATRASIVSGDPVKVTFNGKQVDADVVRAIREVRNRCPQYLN